MTGLNLECGLKKQINLMHIKFFLIAQDFYQKNKILYKYVDTKKY